MAFLAAKATKDDLFVYDAERKSGLNKQGKSQVSGEQLLENCEV